MERDRSGAVRLTTAQMDRACGVLLAQACGDALGVPYEFGAPPAAGQLAEMRGGGLGPYAAGEWSDDTQMAICIAQISAAGIDLRSSEALDAIAENFLAWRSGGASDIGNQTRSVLSTASSESGTAAQRLTAASRKLHERTGHTAGNGALMRTGIVGVAHLESADATAEAARAIAELTHADPLAGDSCVIWSLAVRHAVLSGELAVRVGLDLIPAERRDPWVAWIDEAEDPARSFGSNGFTVTALQAAWAAIVRRHPLALVPSEGSFPCLHLQAALHEAVRTGDDTDTVAAIAGQLLGARWGASAVPFAWRRAVHGWPGMRARDLISLAALTARGGRPDGQGWPTIPVLDYKIERDVGTPLRADPSVVLGTVGTVGHGCDAVVSLCRLGSSEVPAQGMSPSNHLEVWLIDSEDPKDNLNLHFVIDDSARAVRALRAEGHGVLLHCVAAHSRTPAVAARYAVLTGVEPEQALRDVGSPKTHRLTQAVLELGRATPDVA